MGPGSLTPIPGLRSVAQSGTVNHNRLPVDPSHPGAVLLLEFLEPLGITQAGFARHLGSSVQRVNELIKGKRSITAETA
jgi:hypothetical protein